MRNLLATMVLSFVAACSLTTPPSRGSIVFRASDAGVELVETDDGCGVPAVSEPTVVQYFDLTLVQDGRTRSNPKFVFAKEFLDQLQAHEAFLMTKRFEREFREACANWSRANASAKSRFMTYYRESLFRGIEWLTRFERVASPAEFDAEVQRAREQSDRLRMIKPAPLGPGDF